MMKNKSNETNAQELTREDMVSILGGINVMNSAQTSVPPTLSLNTPFYYNE